MSKNIKFNIRIVVDGKEQIVRATASTKELAKNLTEVRKKSDKVRNHLLKWSRSYPISKDIVILDRKSRCC